MEMSQCVPSWDVDEPPSRHPSSNLPRHHYHPSHDPLRPLDLRTDYEVAELTWENGQLALHSLAPPRIGKASTKNPPPSGAVVAATAWNKHHHRSGTLESVVNQATGAALTSPCIEEWVGGLRRSATVDALVPCQDEAAAAAGNNNSSSNRVPDADAPPGAGRKRTRMVGLCSSQGSAAGSLAGRVDSATLMTLDTCREDDIALTATTTTATTFTNSASPETENTSFGKRKAPALDDDHVSISHTSSQIKLDSLYDEEDKGSIRDGQKASASAKKSRAAAIHNQSERKRRDRINQRMKTLQKLVPNSSKTDKASMLDEVIEHLKQLQAQIQMMSQMNNIMMPVAAAMAPPQIPMPLMAAHLAHVSQLPQLGMGMGMMDLASFSRSMRPSLPMLYPPSFLSLPAATMGVWDGSSSDRRSGGGTILPDPYSTFLACQMTQHQPMSLDEYSRMTTLFQQLYQQQHEQPPASNPKS
ncbi:transcription factor UNE10 [Canna indica]|uniref:Transcription factor UNE10 n=1 Tax=Canna indica TaxID=4628 RepID=A0AAQ3KLB5_9LILI|nr:transcription factor UNE10 [Canna indica]